MRSRLFNMQKWTYLAQGALRRLCQPKRCPCCGGSGVTAVNRKYFHTLEECGDCGILFRYPGDSKTESSDFYQCDYAEPGLTTELPLPETLCALMASGFKGSPKDFSGIIALLEAVGLKSGDRILDYGANWGYGTWQLRQAGFYAEGFEISKPRAHYAARLGAQLWTSDEEIQGPFAAVYSRHVLEHVDNPLAVIRKQLALTVPGGFVIAHTPNGSEVRHRSDPAAFRNIWGQVHPFLLTDKFIRKNFGMLPFFISSMEPDNELQKWDQRSQHCGNMSGWELFFVLKNQPLEAI